jgi:beta-phosphoglucomutase family hydrolase
VVNRLVDLDGVLFDLDGVVTSAADQHYRAWKQTFDDYLRQRFGDDVRLFGPEDYTRHVDGLPRNDGVRNFLASRSVQLPEDAAEGPPGVETVQTISDRKDRLVNQIIREEGVAPYPASVALLHRLHAAGTRTAIVSSSRNCRTVLEAAQLADLFDVRVDGELAAELGLAGKPAPDTFLAAADRLGVEPSRSAVIEDALSGVEAGRRGGFGLVVGVDRAGQADALREHGADIVVSDLAELLD